jgi:hypothetical protein
MVMRRVAPDVDEEVLDRLGLEMRTGEVDDRLMLFSAAQTSMISFLGFPDDERRGLQVDFGLVYHIRYSILIAQKPLLRRTLC